MTPSTIVRVGVPLVLLLALAVGCSGGGSADKEALSPADTDAIRAGLSELVAGDHASARETADATCFAEALLERMTPAELRGAGVLDASYDVVAELPKLSRADAGTWVDAQFSCTDFVEQSARAQEQLSHGKIDRGTYTQCLRVALTEDQLRAAVVDTLTGAWDGPDLARFSAAQADCQRQAVPIL